MLDPISLATLIMRVPLGLFFAVRGFQKLFLSNKREALLRTLTADKIPYPNFFKWWVPAWQLLAGSMLAVGAGTSISAAILGLIMLIALLTDKITEVHEKRNPQCCADWFCCITYLSETTWILIFVALMLIGPGVYSIDSLL